MPTVIFKDREDIPAAYADAATEVDGGFEVEIKTIDNAPLLKAIEEERKARKRIEERYAGIDPDAYAKLQADAAKAAEDKAKADGDYDALRTKLTETFAEKEKAHLERIRKLESDMRREAISRTAIDALTRAKGNVRVLRPHVEAQLEAVQNDEGQFVVRVRGNKIGPEGNPLTPLELVESLRSDKDFKAAFAVVDSANSVKPPVGDGTSSGTPKTVSRNDPMTFAKWSKEIAEGTVRVVD